MNMLTLYQNVGASLKCRRTVEMLASYEKGGALLNCPRTILKCWRPMKTVAFIKLSAPDTTNMHAFVLVALSLGCGVTTPEECPCHWGADTGQRRRRW